MEYLMAYGWAIPMIAVVVGAPIGLQNLSGWWPLNGAANDYSDNNNNEVLTGVSFNGMWTA